MNRWNGQAHERTGVLEGVARKPVTVELTEDVVKVLDVLVRRYNESPRLGARGLAEDQFDALRNMDRPTLLRALGMVRVNDPLSEACGGWFEPDDVELLEGQEPDGE